MEELFASWLQSVSKNLLVELDQQQIEATYQLFCAGHRDGAFEKSDLDKFSAILSGLQLVSASTNAFFEETVQQAQHAIETCLQETEAEMTTNNTPKKRKQHDPQAVVTLSEWFETHTTNPYPSTDEKQYLSSITGMTVAQVETWFANARRRRKV